MNSDFPGRLKAWFGAEILSSRGLALRAVLLGAAYEVCELTGLREHTTFLSGTTASASVGWNWSVVCGVTFITLYLAFVLVTPILLLAAALVGIWRRWSRPRGTISEPETALQ